MITNLGVDGSRRRAAIRSLYEQRVLGRRLVVKCLAQRQCPTGRIHGKQVPVLGGRAGRQRIDHLGVGAAVGVTSVDADEDAVHWKVFAHRCVVRRSVKNGRVIVRVLHSVFFGILNWRVSIKSLEGVNILHNLR